MEQLEKIAADLTDLRELIVGVTVANKSLAKMLQKEIKKKDKLQKELDEAVADGVIYKKHYNSVWSKENDQNKEIERLKDDIRILQYEKNILLRKLKIEPVNPDDLSYE